MGVYLAMIPRVFDDWELAHHWSWDDDWRCFTWHHQENFDELDSAI
jgi:hypothetical protein